MLTIQKDLIKTSVRRLTEFIFREGDIHNQGSLVADVETMQAGSRVHRKIQKAQKAGYQAEVPLKMEWEQDGYRLLLEGRADGIDRTTVGNFTQEEQLTFESYLTEEEGDPETPLVYIDEIKGVYQNVLDFSQAKPLHIAQAKCYAAIYLLQNDLDRIGLQITYANIDTMEIRRFRQILSGEEIREWFDDLTERFKRWADLCHQARMSRQKSIDALSFPYEYRTGQKKLIAMIYHSILGQKKAFFQAPTGIGKTISAIYPSLKALSEDKAEEVYYLTAKTITRTVAEDTLAFLGERGLHLKSVTLTARDRICPNEVLVCNPAYCPMAKGHYDRINQALFDVLSKEEIITRETVLSYSDKHQVCPYQLSMELASFADLVICDYNYVFDPHVNRSLMSEANRAGRHILLIDEAHNLVERARSMYSADLYEKDFDALKKMLPPTEKPLIRKLRVAARKMASLRKSLAGDPSSEGYLEMDQVDMIYLPLFRFLDELLEYLNDHQEFEYREEIIEIFFSMRHFTGILETMTEGYKIYGMWTSSGYAIRLFCIDPSSQLKEILENNMSAIFFSATLLPMPYYRNLLYGEGAEAFSIPSPFDGEKRLLCIANDVTSRYSRRNEEIYRRILDYLRENLRARKGNYMIFFPSYEMMEKVLELYEDPEAETLVQTSSMEEKEKEEFLARFQEDREESLVGFCVLGSIFSEGIDLTGKRLIGVLVVGTGIPGIGMERNMIRDYFDTHGKNGYDYAYRYPGMNKVLQAAGRVIRTSLDTGVITLLDDRFLWRENQYLLPEDWDRYYEVNLGSYPHVLKAFWDRTGPSDVEFLRKE